MCFLRTKVCCFIFLTLQIDQRNFENRMKRACSRKFSLLCSLFWEFDEDLGSLFLFAGDTVLMVFFANRWAKNTLSRFQCYS